MKLLVVGAGEMGRWVGGVALAELDADLAFADADPSIAEDAAASVGGRAVALDAGEGSTDRRSTGGPSAGGPPTGEQFDAVCVAVPMSAAVSAIEAHAHRAERALVDVTGRMAGPVDAMRSAAPDRERASLHPLFARANAPGNVAVVADAPGPVVDRLLDALRARGNRIVETTPAEHDEAMTTVQARAHAAVLSFALAADEVPDGLTTPVFEDLRAVAERVAGKDPGVYAEINAAFDGVDRVVEAAERIAEADVDEFKDRYREAGERLDHLDRDDLEGENR